MYRKTSTIINKIVCIAVILAFIATNYSVVIADSATKHEENIESFKTKLDNLVPKLEKEYGVPGTSIGIVEDGEVKYNLSYGVANKKENKLVDDNTIFMIASLSKSFTTWGVMHLVEQGKISLDDPVEKYLTRWHFPDSKFDSKEVTVRMLLSHTGGLSVGGYPGINPDKEIPTLEETLDGINNGGAGKVEIIAQPGSKYSYSGGGYVVLQLLIEEVTKMPFEKYMEEEILKPLGMYNSTFSNSYTGSNMSQGYGLFGQVLPNYNFAEESAAGLKTSVQDFMKFMIASMDGDNGKERGGGILKRDTIDLMYTSVKSGYGLGVAVSNLSDNSIQVGHTGSNRGWRSQYAIIPEKRAGIVVFTNSDNGYYLTEEIKDLWDQYETGILPSEYNHIKVISKVFLIIAIGIGCLLVLYLVLFVRKLMNKRRVFVAKKANKSIFKLSIRLLIPLVFIFAWYYLFYYSMVAFLMPYGFLRITWLVTIWSIVLFISGLFPKINK